MLFCILLAFYIVLMTILRRENVLILKAFNYKLVQNNHCILFFLQVLNHILSKSDIFFY
jgi:hypothetical protein